MQKIDNKEELNNILKTNRAVLLYFSGKACSVCHVLRPKIEDSLKENFPLIKPILVEDSLEISTYFTVFSNPTIIVFFEGKEFKRYGRNISLDIFNSEINRVYEMVF